MNSVHAMTDVTGFGLLGHLVEMTEGSGLGAELNYGALKKLPGVDEYLKLKAIPDATFRNWNSYSAHVQFEKGINVMEAFNLLPDPQTNGGLLIAVSPSAEKEIMEILQEAGLNHQPVGRMVGKGEKTILVKNG
jgi:selenide,water dikinase